MKQVYYIETRLEDNLIHVNVAVKEEIMLSLLSTILIILYEKYHLSYRLEDLELDEFLEHFQKERMKYSEGSRGRFVIRSFPEMTVETLSKSDFPFLLENWNNGFFRTEMILASSTKEDYFMKSNNPNDYLKNPNIRFVITDGDNPDEYSAFGVYTRVEDFSVVYDVILSGIHKAFGNADSVQVQE